MPRIRLNERSTIGTAHKSGNGLLLLTTALSSCRRSVAVNVAGNKRHAVADAPARALRKKAYLGEASHPQDRDPWRNIHIPMLDERHNYAAARAHDQPNNCCA